MRSSAYSLTANFTRSFRKNTSAWQLNLSKVDWFKKKHVSGCVTLPAFPVPALPVLAAEWVCALVHVRAVPAGVVQGVAGVADASGIEKIDS